MKVVSSSVQSEEGSFVGYFKSSDLFYFDKKVIFYLLGEEGGNKLQTNFVLML